MNQKETICPYASMFHSHDLLPRSREWGGDGWAVCICEITFAAAAVLKSIFWHSVYRQPITANNTFNELLTLFLLHVNWTLHIYRHAQPHLLWGDYKRLCAGSGHFYSRPYTLATQGYLHLLKIKCNPVSNKSGSLCKWWIEWHLWSFSTLTQHSHSLEFSMLSKDTLTCGQEELGLKPLSFQVLEHQLYLMMTATWDGHVYHSVASPLLLKTLCKRLGIYWNGCQHIGNTLYKATTVSNSSKLES